MSKKDETRGDSAKTRKSKRRNPANKGSKSHFGYKLHSKVGLIRDIETTTASLHDSQVDLSVEGEVVFTGIRGYFGAETNGYSATMKRGTRGHPIGIMDKLRNLRVSRKRLLGKGITLS